MVSGLDGTEAKKENGKNGQQREFKNLVPWFNKLRRLSQQMGREIGPTIRPQVN